MPVEFLSDDQSARYGRFVDPPSRAQLEHGFYLDDVDRALVDQRCGDHNRLGFAAQLGTIRSLGTFLADPLDVPTDAVAYVAEQLGVVDASCFRRYAERLPTQHEHAREIRRAYGYREYAQASREVRAFLTARCWTSSDGPIALFNQATTWMVEQKVVLPGATVLARLVAEIRAEVSERLWRTLAEAVSPELRQRLIAMLAGFMFCVAALAVMAAAAPAGQQATQTASATPTSTPTPTETPTPTAAPTPTPTPLPTEPPARPHAQTAAPASVAPPPLPGFGATSAQWKDAHSADSAIPDAYNVDPSLPNVTGGRAGAKYTFVTFIGDRATSYVVNFSTRTPIDRARSIVLSEFPADARVL